MSDRTTARVVGALFIVATVAAIVGGALVLPVDAPDPLTAAAAADVQLVCGVLVELLLVLSVIGIAALLFPVLRRCDEGLALAYVGARIIEGVLLLAATVSVLVLLELGQDPGPAGVGSLQAAGALLLTTRDVTYLVGSMVALGVSAVILYSLLYRGSLVPAWLSVWGLLGGVLIALRGVLEMYGLQLTVPVQAVVTAPIAVNEMVLAVWLIAKGFSPLVSRYDEPAVRRR
jgi:hypothetical protein